MHLGGVADDKMSGANRVECHVQLGTRHHPVISAFETFLAKLPGPHHAVGIPAALPVRSVRQRCMRRSAQKVGWLQPHCWCAGGLLWLTPWHDRAGEPCAPV